MLTDTERRAWLALSMFALALTLTMGCSSVDSSGAQDDTSKLQAGAANRSHLAGVYETDDEVLVLYSHSLFLGDLGLTLYNDAGAICHGDVDVPVKDGNGKGSLSTPACQLTLAKQAGDTLLVGGQIDYVDVTGEKGEFTRRAPNALQGTYIADVPDTRLAIEASSENDDGSASITFTLNHNEQVLHSVTARTDPTSDDGGNAYVAKLDNGVTMKVTVVRVSGSRQFDVTCALGSMPNDATCIVPEGHIWTFSVSAYGAGG